MAEEPKSLSAEELATSIPAAPTLGAPLPDGAKTESQLVQEELERLLQNCTPEDQKMYEKRFQIIQELLATEWGYVNDLKTLVATFLTPVRKSIEESSQLLPPDEINNIFSNVEAILGFNEKLYIALRKSLGRGELAGASRVGTVFYRLADFLKMYTIYCQNHKNAVDSVVRCAKKYREFGQFLDKQSALPEVNGLFLKDYLIKPVQRLCKYPLLFQEILKSTPKTHPDYPEIEATIDKVKHVADSINKSTALQENFNKMLEVSERLSGFEIMSSDRWYVKEQTLTGYSSNDKEQELKERHVFLFNDLILFTKLNKKKYQFKEVLRFYNSTVQDHPDNAKKKNYFEVTGLDQDNSQAVFTISCASLKEKTGWLQTVTSTINNWNEKFKGQPQELPKLNLGETPPGSKRSSKTQVDLVREGESASPHHSPSRGHHRQGSNGSTGEKKGRRSQTLEDMAESSEHEEEKKKEKTEDKRSKLKRSASSSKMARKSSISATKKESLAAASKLNASSSGPSLATAKEETELSSSPSSSLELRASSMDKAKMTEVLNQAKEKKDDKPDKDDEVSQLKSKIKKLQQEIRAERRQKNDLKHKYDTLVETFSSIESTLNRIKEFMPPTFAAPPLPPTGAEHHAVAHAVHTEEKKDKESVAQAEEKKDKENVAHAEEKKVESSPVAAPEEKKEVAEADKKDDVVATPVEEKKETPTIEINNADDDAGQPIDSPSGSGSSQQNE